MHGPHSKRPTFARLARLLQLSLLACLSAIPLLACDAPDPALAAEPAPSAQPETAEPTTLTLENSSDEHISGTFTDNGSGLSVHFDSRNTGGLRTVELLGTDGQNILTMSTDGQQQRMSYRGGALVMEGPFERPANLELGYTDGSVTYTGDAAVLDRMPTTPELALLPWASRALGAAGFNGSDYPIALPLHSLALTTAKQLDISVPPLDFDMEGEEGFRAYPEHCPSSTPYNKCGNACFGMCGIDCECWSWYCGTCSCVNDCHWHDWYCSCESIWSFWCVNVFWISCN